MEAKVEVKDLPQQKLLAKRATCKQIEIGQTFGASIQAVDECRKTSGAAISSPMEAVYLQWLESDCEFAAGYVVEGEVALTRGCEWLPLSGGLHAQAKHLGAYEGLTATHAAIRSWCGANGYQLTGWCWESYPVGPANEPDSSKWQTYVHYPVTKT